MITYPLNNIDYTAEDAELYFSTRESGVYDGGDFEATVSGIDNNVTIGIGTAWIHNTKFSGKVVALKTPKTLSLDIADSVYDRIDAIVIQFDANKNSSDVIVKKGTASSSPVAPSVSRTESLYELHIYHIRRKAGATTIGVSDIIDQRKNQYYCGVMFDPISAIDETLSKKGFAADAKAVGEKLNNLSGSTMTLLWENASPTSNFAIQTISMDLSEYDAIMLLTRRSTSVHDIGFGISVLGHRGFAQNLAVYTDVSAGVLICGREFTPSASGILIGGGAYKFSNIAMTACNFDDSYAIPYRIYGIKMGGGSSEGALPSAEGVGF